MCKTITVDGEWNGVRGGKCGKSTSNNLSFSIAKSVETKHPVDLTSPHIACGCRPMLQLRYDRRPIGRMDSAIRDKRGGVCVGWGGTGRCVCGRVHLPPVLTCLSYHSPRTAATHGGLPGAGTWMDGRPGTRRRSLIAGVRLHTNTTLLQYYEQFHAVTK